MIKDKLSPKQKLLVTISGSLLDARFSGSAMYVSNEGALQVLWYSAGKKGQTGLYMSESKDGGNTFGPRSMISEGEVGGTPLLITNRNRPFAVWKSNNGIETMELGHGATKDSEVSNAELPAAVGTPTGSF